MKPSLERSNEVKTELTLNGVLHVSGAPSNLISGSLLEEEGFRYDGKRRKIARNRQELCAVDLVGGLYSVRGHIRPEQAALAHEETSKSGYSLGKAPELSHNHKTGSRRDRKSSYVPGEAPELPHKAIKPADAEL